MDKCPYCGKSLKGKATVDHPDVMAIKEKLKSDFGIDPRITAGYLQNHTVTEIYDAVREHPYDILGYLDGKYKSEETPF